MNKQMLELVCDLKHEYDANKNNMNSKSYFRQSEHCAAISIGYNGPIHGHILNITILLEELYESGSWINRITSGIRLYHQKYDRPNIRLFNHLKHNLSKKFFEEIDYDESCIYTSYTIWNYYIRPCSDFPTQKNIGFYTYKQLKDFMETLNYYYVD